MSWLQDSFSFTYLRVKQTELRRCIWIGKVLAQTQTPGDLEVKYVWKTVINMGLVTLPLDRGLKLASGLWIAC